MTTDQVASITPAGTGTASPQRRAAEAAEALAAEGKSVTNRAVRERAGVAMAVAAEAVKVWNDRVAEQSQAPEPPDTVLARFAGIWREAYTAAGNHFAVERDGLMVKIRASDEEIRSLTQDLSESDSRVGELAVALEQARTEIEQGTHDAEQALVAERARADRAEGALEAVTAERDRLLAQLEAARSKSRG